MAFLRDWMHNIVVGALVVAGVGVFMLIFMAMFYPETLGLFSLTGQFSVQLISALKLWPLVILGLLVSALPRRSRRR